MQSQRKTYLTFLLKHLSPLGYETLNSPFKKSFQKQIVSSYFTLENMFCKKTIIQTFLRIQAWIA